VADQLNEKYSTEVKLVAGRGGSFEVTFDGNLIYSKLETGQFPTIGQITSAIDA
jgi:selT/selW/selH-like putative selenoprotein